MGSNIICFAFGVLFYMLVVPIVDQVASLVCTILEEFKGKHSVKIVEYNAKADKIVQELEKPYEVSHAIGFEVPTYEEYEEYEEDE